jgi:hypothetical protein
MLDLIGVTQLNAEMQPIETKANCSIQSKNRGTHGLKAQLMSS